MAKYKRRNYLINPKFQLRFSLMICIVITLSSIVYPITIYDLVSKYISIVSLSSPESIPQLEVYRNTLITILSLWQIGFTCLVFVVCIFFSHKIAGPLFKLKKHLSTTRETGQGGKLFFRRGDYFHDLAEEVNLTVTKLTSSNHDSSIKDKLQKLEASLPEEHQRSVREIINSI